MLASILGADGNQLCQIPALREGFAALGHQHTGNFDHPDVSFVFVGNPPFDSYLGATKTKKTIFNVLDLCPHCVEHEDIVARLKDQLPLATRVSAISQTVADELKAKCGVDAHVIYYPMKPVHYTAGRKYPQFRAMICGRNGDPNKRVATSVQALVRAGFKEDEVAVVGPEYLGWGVRMGVVSDTVLNDLHNSVDYVMMLSKNEGIGLPAIEGAVCGVIPILACDLSTLGEFWVQSPLGLQYQTLTSAAKVADLLRAIEADPTWKAQLKVGFREYATQTFVPKFDRVRVAERIISLAQSICP